MAKTEVNMPRFGATMKEGEVVQWLVKVGDKVEKGQALVNVQTEKMEAEIESLSSGTVVELVAAEGDTYAVGDVLAYIETDE